MRKSRKAQALGTAATVAVVTFFALLVNHTHGARSESAGTAPVTPVASASTPQGPITIDGPVGESFTPTGPLSPDSAPSAGMVVPSTAYETDLGMQNIGLPADANLLIGRLTLPSGPDTYTAKDKPVYAMTWHQCAPATGGFVGKQDDTQQRCTAWAFVDPSTGDLIDMTWTK